jgi:Domain of unknown function (DUF4440)
MKQVMTVFLLAVAILTPAQTQKDGPPQGTSSTTQVLIDLENKWGEALAKSDTATLAAIFADTYVDTDENSHRSDKQGVLAVLKSGQLKIESVKLSNMKVYDYGDAAVVTGSAAQAGNYQDQTLTASIIFTDTFIRQKGKWKAVASHRSAAT